MSYRSEKCVLIGFSTTRKAYKLLSLDTRNVFYARDVKFYENIFPLKMKTCDSTDADNANEVDHLKFFDSLWSQIPMMNGKIHQLRMVVCHLQMMQQIMRPILRRWAIYNPLW